MNTLPLQLKLGRVLLIGRGSMAQAKFRLLDEMGAEIIWWQEAPTPKVLEDLTLEQQNPHTRLALVVIAGFSDWCTDLATWAVEQRLLLNRVDNPGESNVFFPAIVARGQLRIGIGSGGINPVLVRYVREKIEAALPQGLSRMVSIASRWYARAREQLPDSRQRRGFWESVFARQLHDLSNVKQDRLLEKWLAQAKKGGALPGLISLVGAGPGSTRLLTLDGLHALSTADVVLHDALITPELLKLARRDAVIESVGRRAGQGDTAGFNATCEHMIALARKGKLVCRLKGGDPVLFGRCGEEIAMLRDANVAWKLIPGVTSASAAAASYGFSLTRRETASSIRVINGQHTSEEPVRRPGETLVVYMGFTRLGKLVTQLRMQGESPDLPLALIQNISLGSEVRRITSLDAAAEVARSFNLANGPILIIVGEIVTSLGALTTQVPLTQQHRPEAALLPSNLSQEITHAF